MFKSPKNYLLVSFIFVFSFVYRVVLMLRETYPPGADIGLHNSVIYSITRSGSTDFLYNYFHMGGGSSVTFPGYHIFVSYIMLVTGIPDYLAHAFVVSLFSSLIVLIAFLITRKVWNIQAAVVVAFFVAVSRFDIEILMWGGYPNVITLLLIPLAFYLFLEKDRFSLLPFLTVTSLICGAIFLTHSLSSVLFIAITVATVLLVTLFAGRIGAKRTSLFVWLLPLVLGALIISPFLIQVAPAYFGADASTFTGGVRDIMLATLSTKILPLEIVVPLFACVFLYFLFSRYYMGKFLSVSTILLVLWWLIPTVLTQGYLVGLYTDYERFLYFIILPIIMLIGLGLYHSARFFAQASDWLVRMLKETTEIRINKNKTLQRLVPHLVQKNFALAFMLIFVLSAFLAVPIFATPPQGITVQSYYQLMNKPEYAAINWTRNNTPTEAVFLTDAQYGWWFSGFAQRPTISAVDPQYLTNSREFEPSKAARYMLDTDYLVDNGLIQIREDGGYIGRHNPEFLAKLGGNTYFPYPFFNFDNSQIVIQFRAGENSQEVHEYALSNVPVLDPMRAENNNNESVSIYVTRQNEYFNFTQVTTVSRGVQFVNMTETLTSRDPTVTFDHVIFTVPTKGLFVQGDATVGEIDRYENVEGQIIFTEGAPSATAPNGPLVINYNLGAKTSAVMAFSVGVYAVKPDEFKSSHKLALDSPNQDWIEFGKTQLAKFASNFTQAAKDPPALDIFDYRQALGNNNVSYVAVRDSEQIPRFAKDPMFSLVFINKEVAIFQVRK